MNRPISTSCDYACPKCKGTGRVIYEVDGIEYVKECDCGIWQKQIDESRMRFANLPDAFADVTLKDIKTSVYSQERSKEMIRANAKVIQYWLDHLDEMLEKGMGLYFYSGAKGSGKTLMAAALVNELKNRRVQVKFCTSMQIIEEIKNTWDKNTDSTENELLNQLSTTKVLVIDDFGTEQTKDWISDRFYSIINNRYINRFVTIVTSNYSPTNLPYDERICNRIKERVYRIPFPEESVRDLIARNHDKEIAEMLKST